MAAKAHLTMRYYQEEAELAIRQYFKEKEEDYDEDNLGANKCLLKMFCGTGKTWVLNHLLLHYRGIGVIVFPSISLITQFNDDYLFSPNWSYKFADFAKLTICSKDERKTINTTAEQGYTVTTDIETISDFLQDTSKDRLVAVTYQSLSTFISAIKSIQEQEDNDLSMVGFDPIDILIFDEAHHIIGDQVQKLVFGEDAILSDVSRRIVFSTATPKNSNGVTMYDPDFKFKPSIQPNFENQIIITDNKTQRVDSVSSNDSNNNDTYCEDLDDIALEPDCGPIVYEYTHRQGVNDGYCRNFRIAVDFFSQGSRDNFQNNIDNILGTIARSIIETGNHRVLTFHSFSESDKCASRSNVIGFMNRTNSALFKRKFKEILCSEFPSKVEQYAKVSFHLHAITGKTKSHDKKRILDAFDTNNPNEVHVLSSCRTIGEGIDTKWANKVCFVDSKQSYADIIQNIGRVCRMPMPNMPPAIILLPVWVDTTKYQAVKGKPEERDRILREDMRASGDFQAILNVVSALQADDPEFYELCLNYSKSYSSREICKNLNKQGYKVLPSQGLLIDNIAYMVPAIREYLDTFNNPDSQKLSDNQILQKIADDKKQCIAIHTESMETPIEVYGKKYNKSGVVNLQCISSTESDNGQIEYRPITYKSSNVTNSNAGLEDNIPKSPKRKSFNLLHTRVSSDIKILWELEDGVSLDNAVNQAYIRSQITWNTDSWFSNLENVQKYMDNNAQRPKQNEDSNPGILGRWICNQQTNYYKKRYIMKDDNIRNAWANFVNDPKYSHYFMAKQDKWYKILANLKVFINTNNTTPKRNFKNKYEMKLATWISNQHKIYKKKTQIMKDDEIYNTWSRFINDHNYKQYFINNEEQWFQILDTVKVFIDTNNTTPKQISKNIGKVQLGKWINRQQIYYSKKQYIMLNDNIYNTWDEFVNTSKYSKYFINNEKQWHQTLNNLKLFIYTNNAKPKNGSKNKYEANLARWICTQQINHTKKQHIMKDEKIKKVWNDFLDDPKYTKYFINNVTQWYQKLDKLKLYININNYKPTYRSKSEAQLANWIGIQHKNYTIKQQIMKDEKIKKAWEEFLADPKYGPIIQSTNKPCKTQLKSIKVINIVSTSDGKTTDNKTSEYLDNHIARQRTHAEISQLHKQYKTMNSAILNKKFTENPEDWHHYHKIADTNEQGFDEQDLIPYKQVIAYLDSLKGKSTKYIADLGCGMARVSSYFANSERFKFYNFDHIAINETVRAKDIKDTELDSDSINIAVLCLAMWGSNCNEYLDEAYRILETTGILLIIEPVKRWIDDDTKENKLAKRIKDKGFYIGECDTSTKFMFIKAMKL